MTRHILGHIIVLCVFVVVLINIGYAMVLAWVGDIVGAVGWLLVASLLSVLGHWAIQGEH